MRVFEVWRDPKTGLYFWRLVDEKGHALAQSVHGHHSIEQLDGEVRRLATDFTHTKLLVLPEQKGADA